MNTNIRPTKQRTTRHPRFVAQESERLFSIVKTPVGEMLLVGDGFSLVELHLPASAPFDKTAEQYTRDDEVLRPVAQEITAYFSGDLTMFTVPLAPAGTDFQLSAWSALCEVGYGTTNTYGEIATAIGRPKAPRAVGMANHVNPIALIIPCHRIIGANGTLTGYAGGLDLKRALLSHESSVLLGERPNWSRKAR